MEALILFRLGLAVIKFAGSFDVFLVAEPLTPPGEDKGSRKSFFFPTPTPSKIDESFPSIEMLVESF